MTVNIEGIDKQHTWAIQDYVEHNLVEQLDGPVAHVRVQVLPPISGGYRCRVTARLRDGRDVWCTGVDEHRRVALHTAVLNLRRSLRTMQRGRRIALFGGSAAVLGLAVVTLTAVLMM